jgi:hypothetical protein
MLSTFGFAPPVYHEKRREKGKGTIESKATDRISKAKMKCGIMGGEHREGRKTE